jgi:hypothetical protein
VDAQTGVPDEYETLEPAFLPDLLPTISGWLMSQLAIE